MVSMIQDKRNSTKYRWTSVTDIWWKTQGTGTARGICSWKTVCDR